MAIIKAQIELPNGTKISVEGEKEDVENVISLYNKPSSSIEHKKEKISQSNVKEQTEISSDNIVTIVNAIKDSEESELFENKILDKSSQVDRVLLPLYVVEKNIKNNTQLTSGDIHLILKELGIGMSVQNVSKTLHGTALKYVIGHSTSRKGEYTKYKISRRGSSYIDNVLHK